MKTNPRTRLLVLSLALALLVARSLERSAGDAVVAAVGARGAGAFAQHGKPGAVFDMLTVRRNRTRA